MCCRDEWKDALIPTKDMLKRDRMTEVSEQWRAFDISPMLCADPAALAGFYARNFGL